jgi:cell division protein FtsL
MKHKKILIASIVAVLILIISYTASYYKTLADEHQLALKRNAILEYLKGNNNTHFPIDVNENSKRSH